MRNMTQHTSMKREDFETYTEWIDYCYSQVKSTHKKLVTSAPYKGVKHY